MVLGAIGEIITGLDAGVTQFTQPLLVVLSRSLQDPDAEVRSNAAFASGVLIENSEVDLTSQFTPLWKALQPFFAVGPDCSKDEGTARDNAVGCVARMIQKSSTALPLAEVLPTFFGSLPLRFDALENKAAYNAIFALFERHSDVVMPHVDHLLSVFAYNLDPSRADDLPEVTRERLQQLIGALYNQMPDKVKAAGLA